LSFSLETAQEMLATLLHCWYGEYLLTNIGKAYYLGFTNVVFLYTNIGMLFCFYQCWIPLYQYWHVILDLPMLDFSVPILAYYFCFTNVGFLHTDIGI